MNIRWISTIVLLVTFLSATGVSYGVDEQPCQPDVVVMFGNGVWNDAEDADESRRILEDALEIHVLGTELKGLIEYNTSHNPSSEVLWGLLDFAETYVQDIETNHSKFWRYLAGLDIMPDILQDKLIEFSSLVDSAIVSANPSVQEHIEKYDEYLKEGKVVVLVAHSQGNFYGNIAYLGIDQQYIDGFGIVSIANPDSYVASGGPYTTIDEDYIIGYLPTALASNLDNFSGPINPADWSGHKFIDSYMASGHAAETVILDNVVKMINDLSSLNPGCVYDDFDDGELGPLWEIQYLNADGWTYTESDTFLEVTDIASTVINSGNNGTWGRVILSQPAPALDNFEAKFHIRWDSEGDVRAMQDLYIMIYDENGGGIAIGGYADYWGGYSASMIGSLVGSYFETDAGSLPLSGSTSIRITRENNYIRFYLDEKEMLSGYSYANVGGVEIIFGYYAASDSWDWTSFFGKESVDLISLGPLP